MVRSYGAVFERGTARKRTRQGRGRESVAGAIFVRTRTRPGVLVVLSRNEWKARMHRAGGIPAAAFIRSVRGRGSGISPRRIRGVAVALDGSTRIFVVTCVQGKVE